MQVINPFPNPITTAGDIIVGGMGGVPTRLPKGSNGDVLSVAGGILAYAPVAGGGFPAPSVVQTVYVNKGGNDTTGDGTPTKPYLTIQTAVDSITDATKTKPYIVLIGPGIFTEDLTLEPHVHLIGSGFTSINSTYDAQPTIIKTTGSNVGIGLTISDGSQGFTIIKNLSFNGYPGTKIKTGDGYQQEIFISDISGFFETTGTSNVYLTGFLQSTNVSSTGNTYAFNGRGAISVSQYAPANINLEVSNWVSSEACTFGANFGNAHTVSIRRSSFYSITLDGSGTDLTFTMDKGTTPGDVLTGTAIVTILPTSYVPGDPSDWAGTAPTTIEEAIDRLAAANPGA